MYSIDHSIDISATPATVLAALTTKDGIRAWFTHDISCDADKKEATYRFRKSAGGPMGFTMRLDQADERAVVMTCVGELDSPDWRDTRLAYELAPTASGTRVHLVHSGFRAKTEHYERTNAGWQMFMGSLKKYLETGKGEPHVPAAK